MLYENVIFRRDEDRQRSRQRTSGLIAGRRKAESGGNPDVKAFILGTRRRFFPCQRASGMSGNDNGVCRGAREDEKKKKTNPRDNGAKTKDMPGWIPDVPFS